MSLFVISVADHYRITTHNPITGDILSTKDETLTEIEDEGGFAYLFTVARNLGLGAITVEAL